jgi:hypothetical protein
MTFLIAIATFKTRFQILITKSLSQELLKLKFIVINSYNAGKILKLSMRSEVTIRF